MILPRSITMVIDTREQKPLPFPKTLKWSEVGHDSHLITVKTETKRLKAGDYFLKEAGTLCLIERKGSISELGQNLLTKDRRRAIEAFKKLVEATEHPILALDFPLTQRLFYGPSQYLRDEDKIWTRLAQVCAEFNLQVLSVGIGAQARKRLADLVVRLCLAHYLYRKEEPLCPTRPLLETQVCPEPPVPKRSSPDP